MKKLIGALIIGCIFSVSNYASLLSKRNISLPALSVLQIVESLEGSNDQEGFKDLPSPSMRLRSRDVSLLMQKSLECYSSDEFEVNVTALLGFYKKHSDFLDKKNFVNVDGPEQTGREVFSNLFSAYKECGIRNGYPLEMLNECLSLNSKFTTENNNV